MSKRAREDAKKDFWFGDWFRPEIKDWKFHNNYDLGSSVTRTVTRSQVCFNVIKNSKSDLELFSNFKKHHPPGMIPLLVTMKSPLGSIPNTVITRSMGATLPTDDRLCEDLLPYKQFKVVEPKKKTKKQKGKKKGSKGKKKK